VVNGGAVRAAADRGPSLLIHGSCHCGNITFDLSWDPDPAEIHARACGCSFCVKHGGVWTSNPSGSLRIRVESPNELQKYAFGTATADFHVCRRCGVVPVVTSRIEGRTYAVVSVNAFNDVDRSRVRVAPISFDGEETASRLDRRKRHWIADVQYE
jgi:hypothetical protein